MSVDRTAAFPYTLAMMETTTVTLRELLKTHFGYAEFRPLQQEIVDHVSTGGDSLVLMPTGGGKSLCYQLPALAFDGLTLVVSPLIALMKDQVDALSANGIPAAFLNSTLRAAEIAAIEQQAAKGELKLLYIAPERLANPSFREFLDTLPVKLVAIDEAHCISEWGHDFRPEYRHLKRLRHQFSRVPLIALTATATEKVRADIIDQLELHKGRVFLSSFNRANLTYHVRSKQNSFESLLTLLQKYKSEPTIIYCFSRADTEALAADLCHHGFTALPYHAGLSNGLRRENQEKFIRDEASIMVATIAFGMGIDKPDIRLIVHMDLPKTLEGYYQETGRAGRDNLPSDCILYYSYGDKMKQDFFINQLTDPREKAKASAKLAQVIDFCQAQTCRRAYLLDYFGEQWEAEACDGCDICLNPRETFDATLVTQKILSAVIRTGERFGMNYVVDVLLGKRIKKIEERGHHNLSVFGIVEDFSAPALREIFAALVAKTLLEKNEGEYATFRLGPAGKRFLKTGEPIVLAKPTIVETVTSKQKVDIDYDRTLFEELRVLRKKLAQERNVPPFVIFGDTTLRAMAAYYPQNSASFSRLSGVGEAKLAQFGPIFLKMITAYTKKHGLGEKPVPTTRTRPVKAPATQRRLVRGGGTYAATKALIAEKCSLAEIAGARGVTIGTIINHLEKIIALGEPINLDYLAPDERRNRKIDAAFDRYGTEFLSPVRQFLGEDYSFDEIRLARVLRAARKS